MEDDRELSDCGGAHVVGRNGGSPEARGPKSVLSYCHKERGSGGTALFLRGRFRRWRWPVKFPDGVAAVTFAGEAEETRAVWCTIGAERQGMQVMAML